MSDKKGQYSRLPQDTNDEDHQNSNQPPPYTPSTAPSSPFVAPHQLSYASSSASAPPIPGPSQDPSSLYPPLNYPQTPQHQIHPNYQAVYKPDTTKPPPPLPFAQPTNAAASSQVVLVRPPSRIEDLRTKPGVVVCQHCRHLVLTETMPENGSCTYLGILGLILAGVTSCGCCLLPLCLTSCKDIMHSCPNCHEDIGLYSRIKEKTFPTRVDQ
ncbi:hypothetical protein BG006_010663 [Podila minutissima]|uniref:LITAF domain-containing protein n=1 Tax=Podila minutissima TaxID=64525 RepID=A0A9P5SQ19_9FUNG|nr:hypothetical protein BG006_010663 [Podila minutissima]